MTRIHRPVAILAGIVLLAGMVPALAQSDEAPAPPPRHRMHRMHPGPGGPEGPGLLEHFTRQLDLTDEQRDTIAGIIEKHREGDLGELRDPMREARRNLMRAIHDPAGDEQAVVDAAATVASLERQGAVLRHRMFLEISKVLTEEQLTKLQQLRDELPEPGERPVGPRGGRMPRGR